MADAAGNLFISDNNRIRKIDAATGIINPIAAPIQKDAGDGGNAVVARFNNTRDIIISPSIFGNHP